MKSPAFIAVILLSGLITGCAHVVPPYLEAVENVALLEKSGTTKVALEKFTADESLQVLHSRSNTFRSPYNNSFSDYLREALRLELGRAGRLDTTATTRIEAELLKNELDISGFDIGSQEITARFLVRRNGVIAYDRTRQIRREWGSSWAGAIAIPTGSNAYPGTVRMLLEELYSDPDFAAALR